MRTGSAALAAALIVIVMLLGYLREPPWLQHVESGFRQWEVDGTALRYRWIAGHASFFVPADATAVTIPVKTTIERPEEQNWPITVAISIDDRPADRFELTSEGWHQSTLRMPPRGSRHLRRIDIRADRTREGNRSVQVGEIQIQR